MYYDSDRESDSDEEFVNTIFEDENENEFLDLPRQNNKYYIGACKLIRPDNYYLLLSTISNRMFLQFPSYIIRKYLSSASIIYGFLPNIEILKIVTTNSMYIVVKKTYWIRLVQRHWRSLLKERAMILRRRCSIHAQNHFSIHGRYPYGLQTLPKLCGMLRSYGLSKESKYKN